MESHISSDLPKDANIYKTPTKKLPSPCPQTPTLESDQGTRRASKRLFFTAEEIQKIEEDDGKIPQENGEKKESKKLSSPSPTKKIKSNQKNLKDNRSDPGESVRRSIRLQQNDTLETPPSPAPAEKVKKSATKKIPKTPLKSVSKTAPKNTPEKLPSGFKTPPKSLLSEKNKTPLKPSKTPKKALAKTPSKTPAKIPKTPAKTLGEAAHSKAKKRRGAGAKGKAKGPRFFNKVVYEGVDFKVGDSVYVRRVDSSSDDEELEVDECRVCGKTGKEIMVECDECLGGFHLSCLKPPLREVPKDRWVCLFCNGTGDVQSVKWGRRKKIRKTAREKLLCSEMWAARIERLWKEPDGEYWFTARWYVIPEETVVGRQPHNLKRELFLTNHSDDNQMDSIVKQCFVKRPRDFEKATDGDDVFLCEYEYDVQWHTFKRQEDADVEEESDLTSDDEDWDSAEGSEDDDEDDGDLCSENDEIDNKARTPYSERRRLPTRTMNLFRGHLTELKKVGAKRIPDCVRRHKQTTFEKARSNLMLASSPASLPCRSKEIEEINSFISGALAAGSQCLGRCLYIHGVPGTGKTATVLTVMNNLWSKVDAGVIQPYRFVTINGLKLAQPENLYKTLYEALTGHRVGWKMALKLLNERFSVSKPSSKDNNQPCVLLVDELDLLVTRNQSVLYNIFDWPTRASSRLIVIGIANTMDLPEKLLPRIASRMGMQRLCFGPYSHQQLQEIISSRLNGIEVFEKQAVEFASRKVAAVSGDARRALELCRRAAELAEFKQKESTSTVGSKTDTKSAGQALVSMADVEAAIHEMFQAPHIQMMKRSSRLSKIFLIAMVYEYHKTGMMETTFEKIGIAISLLCTSNGEQCLDWDTLFTIGCRLGACRLLLCEPGVRHRMQKLQLNFPSDDVAFALREDEDVTWANKYL